VCCKTVPPAKSEAGGAACPCPAHENGGADAGAPVPSSRIVSRPRTSSAYVFAAALEAVLQAPRLPTLASSLAAIETPAAPAGGVGFRPSILGRAALGQTENRQRADRKGAEPLENPSPRSGGGHPLRYIVERSRVHVEPPLRVKTDTRRPGERREVGHGVRPIWRTTPPRSRGEWYANPSR
jgi:hypothetical protein